MNATDTATAVADAVLYEGYLLYPYRASADKNRMRFQFGVLVAPESVAPTGEESWSRTECLCEPKPDSTLSLRVRFLHVQARQVRDAAGGAVAQLTVGDTDYLTWDEAVERRLDATLSLHDLLAGETVVPLQIAASVVRETLHDAGGEVAGYLVRTCRELTGTITVSVAEVPGPYGVMRLGVTVANTTPTAGTQDNRDAAMPYAMIGAHTLMALSGGEFLSMTDPPEWACAAAAACDNVRTWPVLVGDAGHVLSSPIILGDFPSIAPESPGPLYDGLEIDEILTLRTMTLTDDEKRQARATDERARTIIDRSDAMPPELLDRLHGTVRYLRNVTGCPDPEVADASETPWWNPAEDASVDPETDSILVDGVAIAKGSRVWLAPRLSGTDAQDMFLVGLTATVQAVILDVDGTRHIAVTLDDDPATEVQTLQGRFRYFDPTEVRPVLT